MKTMRTIQCVFVGMTLLAVIVLAIQLATKFDTKHLYDEMRMALLRKKAGFTARESAKVDRNPARLTGGGLKQFFWPRSDVDTAGGAASGMIYPSKLIVATTLAFSVVLGLTIVLLSTSAAIEAGMMEVAEGLNYVAGFADVGTRFPGIVSVMETTCGTVGAFKDAPEAEQTLTDYCDAVMSTGGDTNPIYLKLFEKYVLPGESIATTAASAFASQKARIFSLSRLGILV